MTVKDVVNKLEKIDNIRDSLEKGIKCDGCIDPDDCDVLLEILDEYVEILQDLKIAK